MDLDSLISTTLSAIEAKEPHDEDSTQSAEDMKYHARAGNTCEGQEVDDLLRKIEAAAPKASTDAHSEASGLGGFDKLLDELLSPDAVLESMADLAKEMDAFLSDKTTEYPEYERYCKQAEIYKELSTTYRTNPEVLKMASSESDDVKKRLDELQALGSPPPEVLEKLMKSEFANADGNKTDLGREFEQFLKEAGAGGLIPGLTPEDEQIINQLTRDPNALKNLLGDVGSGDKNGDCCLM
jgi:hypothetical protein